MGKIILVTGGVRSGKSVYAESLAKALKGEILYIATSLALDSEMKDRIKKHIDRRPTNFKTLEAYKDFDKKLTSEILKDKSGVLLDCITNMISNLLLEKCTDLNNISTDKIKECEDYVKDEFEKLLSICTLYDIPFIFVTNEVGMGLVPEYPIGRLFRDISGMINQFVARRASSVYLCVSGIPVEIKKESENK